MAHVSHRPTTIYTSPGCPDCRMLKQWLTREGVAFAERDISDPDIMAEAKARTGVRVAPISIVEGAVFYGPFHSQQSRLRRSACLQPPERES